MSDDPEPSEWAVAAPGGDALERPPEGEYRVHPVDAGEGQAFVVDAGDAVMVYDGGPEDKNGRRTGPRGERAVRDALDELGVETVDHVVASHLDGDHVGGLAGLLESDDVDVGELHMPDVATLDAAPKHSQQVGRLLTAAEESGVDVDLLSAAAVEGADVDPTRGDPSFSVGEMDVYALGPADWDGAGRDGGVHNETHGPTQNQASAVLYAAHEAGDGLLTGDVEGVSAQQTGERYDLSDARWSQLTHHGGIWGGGHLLDAADPEAVVVPGRSSTDWSNGTGHPHVQRMVDVAAHDPDHVVSTAHNGWSTLTVADGGVDVETARADPVSAGDLVAEFKGETIEENLRNNPEFASGIPLQAAERVSGGPMTELSAAAETGFDGVVPASKRLEKWMTQPALRDEVVDAITGYAESGDAAAMVDETAEAVERYDERLADTLSAATDTEERLVDRIERRDRYTQATREAVEAVPDETLDELTERRAAVRAEVAAEGEAEPETLDDYLDTASDVLKLEGVDRDEVSVDGVADLHEAESDAEAASTVVDTAPGQSAR